MRIDEMQAGREMDALVAREIMGWLYTQNAPEGHYCKISGNSNGWWKAPDWKGWACAMCEDVPPNYSTDIAAAWEVVEWSKQRGWGMVLMNRYTHKPGRPFEYGADLRKDGVAVVGFGETAPLAICRAALKAVTGREEL